MCRAAATFAQGITGPRLGFATICPERIAHKGARKQGMWLHKQRLILKRGTCPCSPQKTFVVVIMIINRLTLFGLN